MRMKSKKGLTEADWAMSMGIFILYLAWFFVVIKPTFSPETKMSLPFDELKKSFTDDVSWTVNKTPIIIRSNITSGSEPIIVRFPYSGNTEQFYIQDKYIKVDEGKLFFLADLKKSGADNTQILYLLHSMSNYTNPSMTSDLTSSEDSTSTDGLTINYQKGVVKQGFFKNAVRILYYSIKSDGTAIDTSTTSHTYNSLFSKHKIITPEINHTSYVIFNNSKVYNYLTSITTKTVKIGTRLHQYSRFYVNSNTGGSIKYNQSSCDTYTTDYIDLYDAAYGLAFVFDSPVSLELCHNKNLSVTAEFDVDGEFGYYLMFHSTDIDMTKMTQPYKLIFGANEVFEGLSDEYMFNFDKMNYSDIRSDWGYSYAFNVTVFNSTNDILLSIGESPIKYVTTAGQTFNYNKLDKYGNMSKVSVVMLSW